MEIILTTCTMIQWCQFCPCNASEGQCKVSLWRVFLPASVGGMSPCTFVASDLSFHSQNASCKKSSSPLHNLLNFTFINDVEVMGYKSFILLMRRYRVNFSWNHKQEYLFSLTIACTMKHFVGVMKTYILVIF